LRLAAREGLGQKTIETAAIERLKSYSWPGNVRELENFIRRLAALHIQDTLSLQLIERELADAAPSPALTCTEEPKNLSEIVERYLSHYFAGYGKELPPPGLYDRIIREVELPLLTAALVSTRGNQIRAAELLGLNRNTLRSRIKDLDIQVLRAPMISSRTQ
jgi:two-component system nitrogen regulation response regulator GlnG